MTPEQIQQAHELAAHAPKMGYALIDHEAKLLADAVLALTEQQPEPVSRDDLADVIDGALEARMGNPDSIQGWDVDEDLLPIADRLLSRYTITRKPIIEPNDGKPICECGEPVKYWGRPCAACRIPADPEDAVELARGYQADSEADHGE